jgi:beta-lactamase regulating signal transducer with metallopeptidase domain
MLSNRHNANGSQAPAPTSDNLPSVAKKALRRAMQGDKTVSTKMLWIILIMGVLFCMVDFIYIVRYVFDMDHHSHGSAKSKSGE